MNAFVGYTARIYQPASNADVDWKLLFIQPDPPKDHRGGAIFPIEGNRWIVSSTSSGFPLALPLQLIMLHEQEKNVQRGK